MPMTGQVVSSGPAYEVSREQPVTLTQDGRLRVETVSG